MNYYIKHSDRSDYIVHSSGPWKKHKYLKKIGDGANAVYEYAANYANGVKNANRDYQRAKDDQTNAQAFSKLAREEAPRGISNSKRRERAAINAYNHTGNRQYLKRASQEQQEQTRISRGVYNSARVADNATQRVANAKKYRKRAATKPARDLVNLIKGRKKKRNLRFNSYYKGKLKFGKPTSVGDKYNIKRNKDGSTTLTPKKKQKKQKKDTVNLGHGKTATFSTPKVGPAIRKSNTNKPKKRSSNKINLGHGKTATFGKVKLN